jgi:hypothetical protein
MSEGLSAIGFIIFIVVLIYYSNKSYHEDFKTYYRICEISSSKCEDYPYNKVEADDLLRGLILKQNQTLREFQTTAAAANVLRSSRKK